MNPRASTDAMNPTSPNRKNIPDPQFLGSLALFTGLSPDEIQQVASTARLKQVESGSFLFFQDDPATRIYVLLHGRVRLAQVTPEGQQVILRYITPVEAFAVVAALSDQRYPVSAEAVESSQVLVWEREAMEALMVRVPRVALNALRVMSGRVREFQDRLRELATERVERRIARALLRLVRQTGRQTPEGVLIDFPITRQDLAEMTGTTLYTVSRTLSQWETRGIIQSGRERIVIRFPHGLVAIAEDLPEAGG